MAVGPAISPSVSEILILGISPELSLDAATAPLPQEFMGYTPSTVLESAGRTPPPMATPPSMSFSDHLAYIDAKLLRLASNQRQSEIQESSAHHYHSMGLLY